MYHYTSIPDSCTMISFRSGTTVFRLEYQDDGAVAVLASNDRYLTARMNGSLYADRDSANTEKERFVVTVVNRPLLILKCDYGFVGLKSAANPRLECNKATYEIIVMEHTPRPEYYFKGRCECQGVLGGREEGS